jgi:hypothetical protein
VVWHDCPVLGLGLVGEAVLVAAEAEDAALVVLVRRPKSVDRVSAGGLSEMEKRK